MIDDMEKKYDFSKVGKDMPYTIPEGFFEGMEENIRKGIEGEPEKRLDAGRKHRPTALRWIAVAACIAILAVGGIGLIKNQNASNVDAEYAFQQLSEEDQDFLLAVYQDDIFINQ